MPIHNHYESVYVNFVYDDDDDNENDNDDENDSDENDDDDENDHQMMRMLLLMIMMAMMMITIMKHFLLLLLVVVIIMTMLHTMIQITLNCAILDFPICPLLLKLTAIVMLAYTWGQNNMNNTALYSYVVR